jgi:hypothetical protein
VPDGGTEEAPGEAPGTVPGTAPPAERPERPEPVSGQWSLASLGRLVARHGEEFPARLEEWRYYLVYLRDVTGPDGLLPAEFDGLVRDVFGDLVGRP